MGTLIKDVTFRILSGGYVRCNACGEKLKQKRISEHRSVHSNAAPSSKEIPHNVPSVPPPLESAGRIEPQEVEVLPSYPERVVQEEDMEDPLLREEDTEAPSLKAGERECVHCEHRFFGNKVYCPECREKWYQ